MTIIAVILRLCRRMADHVYSKAIVALAVAPRIKVMLAEIVILGPRHHPSARDRGGRILGLD